MKHRVVITAAALMLLISAAAMAQGTHSRPHVMRPQHPAAQGFGLEFGYVHSSYRTTEWATEEVERSGGLDGFVIGLTKDFMLVPRTLYIQTGLEYIYQNDSRKENDRDFDARVVGDRTEHHMGLPIKLKYTYPITYNIGVAVDFGPTLLMGLSSRMQYRAKIGESTSSATYNIYKAETKLSGDSQIFDVGAWMVSSGMLPEGKLRRFDVMLGASVGADFFDILEVRIGYDWGLVNRYKGALANDFKMKRGQLTLSAGVRF